MKKYKISDFIDQIGDGIHGTPDYIKNGEYYFINGNNLVDGQIVISSDTLMISKEEYDRIKKPLNENTILLSINGTLGKIALYNGEKVALGKSACYINVKKDKNKYFVKYILATKEFQKYILLVAHGSTIKNLAPSQVADYEFNIPNELNQDKVAFLLKAIDDKIQNNNMVNDELESMAKTIYDYWFLQFEFPNEEGKPYKSSGGKMVWNEEMKREIPEGWKAGRLNQLIKQDKGGDWGKELPEGNYLKKVTCLRGSDIPSICGTAKLEAPERFINEKNTFKILKEGDLIIEISGGSPTQSTGRICYINANVLKRFENEIITSNFCKAINLIDKDFMYWFYILWCKLYDSGVLYKYEGKTTGIKNLLFEMFCRDYPIIIPNTNVIKKYNNKMENLFDVIQKNLLENAELSSLRDFLLPLLMNGQVGFKS